MTTVARRGATLLAVPALLLALAGCGGADDPEETPSPSAGASDASEAGDPTASSYLSVGEGVELTEPGSTLSFGDAAVIAWEPRKGRTAVLDVTVDRVDRTSFEESFDGWIIPEEMKRQTPLFVRMTVKNAGEGDLGGENVPIAVIDDEGIRVQPTTATEQEFEPCPGGPLPKKLGPGKKTELCLMYLLAPGASFDSVGFLPVDAESQPAGETISWEGKLTRIDDGKGDKGGKNKGGNGRR